MISHNFLDEKLFSISLHSPWFTNIANYLIIGKLPPHFSPIQQKQLIRESATYTWIDGTLYKHGIDNVIRKYIRKD